MATQNITITTRAEIMEEIKERCGDPGDRPGTIGDTLTRDTGRYYHQLREARLPLREQLSSAELMLIVDCCNGTMFTADTICALLYNVQDSISLDGLDEKWGVDAAALLTKLKALSPIQTQALVDAIERFWKNPERYFTKGSDVLDILA